MRIRLPRLAALAALCTLSALPTSPADPADPPYEADPEIVESLRTLGRGDSLLLPEVRVQAPGLTLYNMDKRGPGQRDYCNKMAYAPERETALYAGGNHQSPHRMNDVWEFHLGSNTWHLLYAPDGGNAGRHKAAYFLTSRTLVKDPAARLEEKQRAQIAAYKTWWEENVIFENGHLTTSRGGPIMPAHTWDAFCYDAASRRLVWGMGASPASQPSTHAHFTSTPTATWEKKSDPHLTPMWTFDPVETRWHRYRTEKPRAALRGMGATMAYLPDSKKVLWYVAAQNVSPHAAEMWTFDSKTDTWSELKPNGGKSVAQLAFKEHLAPISEVQSAYSPKHRTLVAVLKNDTFAYGVAANSWSKLATNESVYDAHSVFAYDPGADLFVLAFPPGGRGKQLQLATFSLETRRWTHVDPGGDGPVPPTKYGSYTGYFDPTHKVLVIQGRYANRVWAYRP